MVFIDWSKLVITTRQVHDLIEIPIYPKCIALNHFKKMAAYGKDAFVYGDEIDNLSEFDDNLEVLEACDDEKQDGCCLCGKANDDEMIMCESEECTGCIWYHYACAGFPNGNVPDEDEVWTCAACQGIYFLF